jgi:hypothetical protein
VVPSRSIDRRRIYVELTAEARDTAARFYSDHAHRAEHLYPRYTEDQLELLLDFLRGMREFNSRKACELETSLAENRRR